MSLGFEKALVIVTVVLLPATALAYIDPGTGSILVQGIIAAIAAIGVTLKLYWHRFVGLFRRRSKRALEPGASIQEEAPDQKEPDRD